MAVRVLPLSLIADDSGATAAYDVTEALVVETTDADNDELLEGYIEELFYEDLELEEGSDGEYTVSESLSIPAYAATFDGEDAFSSSELYLEVYTEMKSGVDSIASGETSSSIVETTLTNVGTYTASSNSEAAQAFLSEFDYALVVYYVLNDSPYEMYWYDKTEGAYISLTYSYSYSNSKNTYTVTPKKLTFKFTVASGYQDSTAEDPTYTVDSSKVTAAKTAVANAQTIAAKYESLTGYEKLAAFRDEICDLVSYESSYSTADYGDIWQLVYVFDGDSSTNVVCEGYSKAFQYLCDLTETDNCTCLTVTGNMYSITSGSSSASGGAHMWNVVCLDGVNYLVDITNSDSGTVGQSGGLFMVCADDATTISDGTSGTYGYAFKIGRKTISYTYSDYSLSLYSYDEYLALGTKFFGKTLTLDGAIGVTYYFTLAGVENPEDYYLVASYGSTSGTYTAGEVKTVGGIEYYRYTVYVGVADINSDITAYLTTSDGSGYSDAGTYSVAEYCTSSIEDDDDGASLCQALLTYGYYAGVYTGESTGITGYTDASSISISIDESTYSSDVTSTDGFIKTLTLGDVISVGVYMTSEMASTYGSFIVDGETYTPVSNSDLSGTEYSDYNYYFEFEVPARYMYKMYSICDSDGNTITKYSVYSYILNNQDSTSSGLSDLCKAIYNYGTEAKAYTGWH